MRTCAGLALIISGCTLTALPVLFDTGNAPWNVIVKMSSACLGIAMAITGLCMLVDWNEK